MRTALTDGLGTLKARLKQPEQVTPDAQEAEMPPYMESFLAHLRLLVGVPFEYLIPDPRLLPDESIRFFYLDRSWADRLVDGAATVGKIGSREQAHHHAQAAQVSSTLDVSERMVRTLQRGKKDFRDTRAIFFDKNNQRPANLVTGFILRSGAVSGWPHMDVRAYSERIPEPLDVADAAVQKKQLRLLRLERLSPGVMLALFDGVPELVTLEEPHHGVQFGIDMSADGVNLYVPLRAPDGQLLVRSDRAINVPLPTRAGRRDVVDVKRLRDLLQQRAVTETDDHGKKPIAQTGAGAFAIAVLNPPWRQRFEGLVDKAGDAPPENSYLSVSQRVRSLSLRQAVIDVYQMEK